MKNQEIKKELAGLKPDALQERATELRRALFSTRINASTTHVKDYSQFKKMRKNIARALTYLRQRKES